MGRALVVWFTGLSGSGKSRIANLVADRLGVCGISVEIIDGDNLRHARTRHLGFSPEDIIQNNRMAVEMCLERINSCDVVLVALISPFRHVRQLARERLGDSFIEIYVKASLETVCKRDPKGLYERARLEKIEPMIGMADGVPYEAPEYPDLVLDTEAFDAHVLAQRLDDHIEAWLVRNRHAACRRRAATRER